MHLLLTYLHMYWRLSVLQDIYVKCMGNMIKRRNQRKRKADLAQWNQIKAHPTTKPGSSTNMDATQAHAATDQRRTVATHASQHVAAPQESPPGPTILWWFHQCA